MTPSFYYCSVIWVPNANEFLEDGGSPELKNNFSKKIFYNHKKILLKSSFDHKKIFLRNHSQAQDSLWKSYQDSWRTLYILTNDLWTFQDPYQVSFEKFNINDSQFGMNHLNKKKKLPESVPRLLVPVWCLELKNFFHLWL